MKLVRAFLIWLAVLLPVTVLPQQQPTPSAKNEERLVLEDATPVKLKLLRELSSTKEKIGDLVAFEVIEEVKIGDLIVIPQGALASGTVLAAQPARRMGRTGKLDVRIDFVRLTNDKKVNLRAIRRGPDGSRKSEMALEIAGTGLLFFPAAPLWLLQKGEDISIPNGTLVTSFVNGDHRFTQVEILPSKKPPEKPSENERRMTLNQNRRAI